MKLRSLELFSGAGGLAKGLEFSGFEHEAFVEFNKHAGLTLTKNFDASRVFCGDAREFDFHSVGQVDLIAGGPPCQPFSLGGRHQANLDDRDMFPVAAKAIEELQPRAFIFENVKGLLRKSFREYFEYTTLRLTFPGYRILPEESWEAHLVRLRDVEFDKYQDTKYDVTFKLLNAADYGVPQKRERVFIVGVRSDLGKKWSFSEPTHTRDRLLWDQYITGDYWKRHGLKAPADEQSEKMASQVRNKLGFIEPTDSPWLTIRDALKGTPDPAGDHEIVDHVFRGGARTYPGHTGSDIDSPAKTIKAGVHGVPGGENMILFPNGDVRYLTVYEGKILQTFPKSFDISGGWGEGMRQIGNAVPVELARKIGSDLHSLISETESDSRGEGKEVRMVG